MISTNQFKNGLTLLLNGAVYTVVEYQHVKPGKGGAFVRTKLKRLKDGAVTERTFRAGEKCQEAYIEERTFQFLYRSGEEFHFMDQRSFEDLALPGAPLGAFGGVRVTF